MYRLILWPVLLLSTMGCHFYSPHPLDHKAHSLRWKDRSPFHSKVIKLVKELEKASPSGDLSYNPKDGLSLSEGEIVALVFNRDINLAHLQAKSSSNIADQTGWWPDPEVELDGVKILQSVAHPWIWGSALKLTIPWSGHTFIDGDRARAQWQVERWKAYRTEVMVLGKLRLKWIRWSLAEKRYELAQKFIGHLEKLLPRVTRLHRAGEVKSTELRLFQLELVRSRTRLRFLEAERQKARWNVLGILGLHPESKVKLVPQVTFTIPVKSWEELREMWKKKNPDLQVKRAAYQVAEYKLKLEIRRQFPDLVLGPMLERENDAYRFGGTVGFTFPLWNLNRENIARAQGARKIQRAQYYKAYERGYVKVKQSHLSLVTAGKGWVELREKLAPQVDIQLKEVERLAQLGEFHPLFYMDTLRRWLEAHQEVFEAAYRLSHHAVELETMIPSSNHSLPREEN